MARNEAAVREKYRDGQEAARAFTSRYAFLEFYYTQKHIAEYIRPGSAVIELGCGTGYYAIQFAGTCQEYLGVDITPENIAIFEKNAKKHRLKNARGQVGDATCLNDVPDSSFDVVLCLGPLYHLPPDEQRLVFSEWRRICRQGGIAAFAYINKVGVYAGACMHESLRQRYPSQRANELVLGKSVDDVAPELFFFTMPEEIEAVAGEYGFSKLKNLGTDFFMTMGIVHTADDEKFELLKPLLDQMASYGSCTGMSNHAVLVCRKQAMP